MDKYGTGFKARTWFVAAVLAAFAAGCGDGIFGGGGGPGGVPTALVVVPGSGTCLAAVGFPLIPQVNSSVPSSGALNVTTSTTGVAPSKLITATFSIPMNPATINSAVPGALLTFTLTGAAGANVPGTVLLNGAGTMATFTTSAALAPNTLHTATITTAAMSAGAPNTALACTYRWNFTTGPVATGLAPINLGLATPFAIASAGGITNSGATKINGDVVLDPNQTCNAVPVGSGNDFGLCPANPPTNNAGDKVITQIFPDTTTADAVIADLNATWISIAPAALPGGTVLGCGTIGTGGGAGALIGCAGNATLPPGVYISATSSTIDVTGNLTLDAGGNPDAVWVFQAPSALTMNVGGTSIILAGGAKASNVWWFVGSSASLNTGVISNGNILASAAITMGTGATSCGRLLAGAAGAGNFTQLANTVSVPSHPNAPVGCQ